MIRDESILCFAPDPWDDIWRNRHQIMSVLAQQNQVLYVEPRPYLRDSLRSLRGGRLLAELRAPRLTRIGRGLSVFRPPWYAPLSGRPPLNAVTDALRGAALNRAMGRLGMQRPILWLFRPEMSDLPGRYGERFLIYHIVDEYTGYAALDAQRIEDMRRREQTLMARADLVLVTSRELLESKATYNANTHWVANGVDYPRFAAAAADRRDPEELSDLGHPRIGYVGAINDKIDVALLLRVAESFPEASLVLVGPERPGPGVTARGLRALRARANVRFVGQVPVSRVPQFVSACDVGLLPYQLNEWTRHIHPLKLYEYLACGLPVVATAIPSLWEEGDLVRIAEDEADFCGGVAEALAGDSAALRCARQERAARNTWQQRVERISELILTSD